MTEHALFQPNDPNRRLKAVFLGVFVVTLVLVGAALYFTPWVSEEIEIGYSDEANRNPFLAAESFLNELDVRVKTQNGLTLLDNLPPIDDSLLIASSRRSLSERRVNDLTNWVHSGGRLILLASDLFDETREDKGDELLNNFGIWLYEGEPSPDVGAEIDSTDQASTQKEESSDELTDSDEAEPPKSLIDILRSLENTDAGCSAGDGLTQTTIDGEARDLVVDMPTTRHLYFEDNQGYAWAGNSTGAQLVYVEHGDGSLYVLTSLNQWRNRRIGCFDHAHLLRVLTESTKTLWLMFNTEVEPIHLLIWNRWSVAVAFLAIWLVLWLWRNGYRTVRIEPEEVSERREVIEHIGGMSRFLYQQKNTVLLLSALRAECIAPDLGVMHKQRQLRADITRWSKQLGVSEKQIQWALTAKIPREGKKFTDAVALLQKIRELPKAQPSSK